MVEHNDAMHIESMKTRHGLLSGIQKQCTIVIIITFCSRCFDRQWGYRVSVGRELGILLHPWRDVME